MIVFFIRRSNDVDHLAPVIWAAARRGERVTVLSMNPYLDLHADYRLQFLRSISGVSIGHVYEVAQSSRVGQAISRSLVSTGAGGRAVRWALAERWWSWVRTTSWFNAEWAARALASLDADLLVFDWVKPQQHVTAELLTAARRNGVPTVALPHGLSITTTELRTKAAVKAGELPDYDRAFPFDQFVAPHADHAEYFIRGGMPRSRVAVLGSARFCGEWVAKGQQIAPDARAWLGPDDGRLKVVFFDKDSFSLDRGRAEASVHRMAALPFVRLVMKPQTRNNKTALDALGGLELRPEVPSVSLTAWADVVVGTVSSVLVEPLCVGKPLVYPGHHCEVRTVLQDMKACWEVDSDDALEMALKELASGEKAATPCDAIAACLDRIVYADSADHDVLRRYVSFLDAQHRQ